MLAPTRRCRLFHRPILIALACGSFAQRASSSEPFSFNAEIRPILVENCFSCHGPDAAARKAGLRLDDARTLDAALASGEHAVVPGDRAASAIFQRVAASDAAHRMPPVDSGKSLSPEEIERIGTWIDAGAAWDEHWAFHPLTKPAAPAHEVPWIRNDIDRFVYDMLERHGLEPSPEADRRTLIRRLTFDLWGLPPSLEEVETFVNDAAPDAYARLTDRLLASPHYGERWARHWLDIVHYGDTHGYDKDKRRPNAWPYRDYVIEALNRDMPYGQFVREQLAADVAAPDEPRAIAALGFVAAGPWDFVGHVELREDTTDKAITRVLDRDDMVMNTMNTFVSMTVQCARCHDHKFDPISQAEYYGLQAVFAGVDRADRPMDTSADIAARRARLMRDRSDIEGQLADVERVYVAARDERVDAIEARLAALREQLAQLSHSPANGYHSAIEPQRDVTKWVQVDLGTPTTIDTIELLPARPTDFPDTPGFGFPVRFRVDVSTDDAFKESITIADETGSDYPNAADLRYRIDAAGLRARYVRVVATRLWERTNDFAFALAELRVLSRGSNVALDAPVTALDSIEAGRWSMAALVDGYTSRRVISDEGAHAQASDDLDAELRRLELERDARRAALADPGLAERRDHLRTQLDEVVRELDTLPAPVMVYAAASEFKPEGAFTPASTPRPVHVLRRGDVHQEAEPAVPGALRAIKGLESPFTLAVDSEAARRRALAEWIADPGNPLTWRSIANRVWQYHFGRGIVETPSDFGHMGAMPTHPELLDWLACTLLDEGQSLKALHKHIVTSATYRQSSASTEAGMRTDANNQFLWRMNRRQLDAESLRDATLAVSGKLDLRMGGPGFDLFEFKDDHSPGYFYDRHDASDPASFRRSIYRFIVRSVPDPFMTCLDSADPSQGVPVRNTTITALQALAVFNNPFMVQHAAYAAERLESMCDTLPDRVVAAYRLALSRSPSDEELILLTAYARVHGLANAVRVLLNTNEFMFVD